ncbi:MAG: helix-turn-helix transcriptional regulator [Candidatus Bathyarchaeota archaeon]|nr:MAG: helix-turn-helix transcriptional regulator [Candidatus Bathyarchaeota archaeon]
MGIEGVEEVIIQALNHSERRNILKIINVQEKGALYSDILGELGIPTGTLNYHLKQLEGLIERDEKRRYHLTPLGEQSLRLLFSIGEGLGRNYETYLRVARHSQKRSVHPTVSILIVFGIIINGLLLFIWGYVGYTIITEGGPTFVLGVTGVLSVLGLITLAGLIHALRAAPEYVRKIERKLGIS